MEHSKKLRDIAEKFTVVVWKNPKRFKTVCTACGKVAHDLNLTVTEYEDGKIQFFGCEGCDPANIERWLKNQGAVEKPIRVGDWIMDDHKGVGIVVGFNKSSGCPMAFFYSDQKVLAVPYESFITDKSRTYFSNTAKMQNTTDESESNFANTANTQNSGYDEIEFQW